MSDSRSSALESRKPSKPWTCGCWRRCMRSRCRVKPLLWERHNGSQRSGNSRNDSGGTAEYSMDGYAGNLLHQSDRQLAVGEDGRSAAQLGNEAILYGAGVLVPVGFYLCLAAFQGY